VSLLPRFYPILALKLNPQITPITPISKCLERNLAFAFCLRNLRNLQI